MLATYVYLFGVEANVARCYFSNYGSIQMSHFSAHDANSVLRQDIEAGRAVRMKEHVD